MPATKPLSKTENPPRKGAHHLMRVRVRWPVWDQLKEVAEEESAISGAKVTVSDLVRAAVYNYLLIHKAARNLEASPPLVVEGEVLVVPSPLF